MHKQRILLLFAVLLLAGALYAQPKGPSGGQHLIDSLLKDLPKQKEDTNKVKTLNTLAVSYRLVNPDEGIKYGQLCLEMATKLEWQKGIAMACNALGANYAAKANYPQALEYLLRDLKIDEESGDKQRIARVTRNIGSVYQSKDDYPTALEYYFKALKLFEGLGDKAGIAVTTGVIGNVFLKLNDFSKALEYYLKALKLNEETGNKNGIAEVSGYIGVVYSNKKDYPKALEYYRKALEIYEQGGNKHGIQQVNMNMGAMCVEAKEYALAVEYNEKALKIAEEIGAKHDAAGSLCNIGAAYLAIIKDEAYAKTNLTNNGDVAAKNILSVPRNKAVLLGQAIDYLQRSLVACKEANSLEFLQNAYGYLSEAYKIKGDYKRAMQCADSARIINDSLLSATNMEKIAKLENDRKEYADSLKAASAKKVADINARHRRTYEYIGGGVLALLLCFTFVLTRNNKLLGKEKKRSDDLLLNILPEEVAGQLKETGSAAARHFDDVTILFSDFVDFTKVSERMTPQALVEELDTCFKKFDEIVSRHNVEKIKTIGDAYLACAGLPTADPRHAHNAVQAALEISMYMDDRHAKLGDRTFRIRIGIHSGSVVAGIVGIKKFAYDIWGDTVNTAARMEQSCEPGRVNISETTYALVKDKISCEYRGEIEAKGKGAMKMYYAS